MKVLAPITQDQDAVSKAYVDGLLADYAKSESLGALASKDSLSFSDLTAKPATLSGYGINDAVYFVGTMNDPNTAYFRHVGYGYGEGGWHGAGPAFGFGANGTYYARIQALNSPDTPYLFFQSNSGGVAGKWFRFLFAEGNDNIESGRFSCKGDIVLHRNEDAGDTFLNYGPYANDGASLFLYGKNVGIVCTENFTINGAEVIASNTIANHTAGKANQLATARKIWGQTFDGTKDISGELSNVSKVFGEKIEDPVHEHVFYEWRIIHSNDILYLQSGTTQGDRGGSIVLSGYNGAPAGQISLNAATSSVSGALAVEGSSTFKAKVTATGSLEVKQGLNVTTGESSFQYAVTCLNGLRVGGEGLAGITPEGGSYPRFRTLSASSGFYFQAASYDGMSQAGKIIFSGMYGTQAEEVLFISKKASFACPLYVSGILNLEGLLTAQEGIMITPGKTIRFQDSDTEASTISFDSTKGGLNFSGATTTKGTASFTKGIEIAAGQTISFVDSNGIKRQIAYDEEKGAIKVIGDFYTTGENAAGNAGEAEDGTGGLIDTELSETSENAVSNAAVTRAIVENEEVTAAALNDLNERVNAISENVSGETATKVELQSAVESLTNTILENEEVTAAALNELNERIENSGGGGEIDTELSETSENAIANRVVTAEFNNIKEKIEGIENIVADNKVLLYLTIEGEPNNTLFEDVKATITYGDTTVVAGNETVILPTFTEVTITFPSIDGYNKPQDIVFTTGWSDTIYKTGVYSILMPSYISIDQTITDPALMITGDINGYEIQKIRNNSHRYLGKYTAEGTMTLCQLDDSDSTKYADGSTADLTGAEGDVFVKLPRFWYKAEEIQSDVWRIGFMCGNIAPSSEWKEWDGNDLIGAYEAYVESSKVYSRSGVSSSANIAPSTYIANGASRGKGFSLVKWHHHNMMAFLFYAMYGNTNCQAIVGSGTSVDSKPTGQTDLLGMEDTSANTNGNSQSINFWGLENWWGNKFEIVDNITYASKTYYITEDDGVIRDVYSGLSNGSIWPKKLKIGEYLDCVPTLGGGSATTGYCDTCSPTDSGSTVYYLRRSYPREITGCGVVAFNTASSATSNGGSRLAFKGSIIEETNVNRFKLMEAIA
ncbi:MAG: hypothetical protein IKT59_08990 [Bacteroidales bacterium]|nr:hypothetical protein [Bacteroidales bacterium]